MNGNICNTYIRSSLFCNFLLFKEMCHICFSFCNFPKIRVCVCVCVSQCFVHSVPWVNIMGWLNASEKQDALWPAFLHCNAIVNDSRWSLQRLRHLPFIVLWTRDHLGIYKWDKKLAIIITKLATWSRSLFRFKDGVWFNSYFSLLLTQFTELMETADHFTPDGDNTCQKLS